VHLKNSFKKHGNRRNFLVERCELETYNRYERSSLLITTNQAFSEWNSIFGDNMMTVASIDRVVHHTDIYKLEEASYRKKTCFKITPNIQPI